MRFVIRTLLLFLFPASNAIFADDIDDLVTKALKSENVPGIEISITRGSEITKNKGYGLANLEWNIPCDSETVFELGSVTKQFTAVGIAMLFQQNKLRFDDLISKHLDFVPNAWSNITIRHLLTHTSGIKNYTSLTNFMDLTVLPATPLKVVGAVKEFPLEFEPGSRYSYSNTGYYLLGCILENASGQNYGAFLKDRIFHPLGMTHTRVNENSAIIPKRASGYESRESKQGRADYIHYSWPFAAGAILSTANDVAKWNLALQEGKVLSPELLEELWTPQKLSDGTKSTYACGWDTRTINGHKVLEHAGGIPGFTSFARLIPDQKLSVTVLFNSSSANPAQLAARLTEAADPDLKPTPIADDHPELTEKLRQTLKAWSEADLSKAPLSARMREHLEQKLPQSSKEIESFGALEKIEILEATVEDKKAGCTYRLIFEKSKINTSVLFDAQRDIIRLELHPE